MALTGSYDVTIQTTFDANDTNTTVTRGPSVSEGWSIAYNVILILITIVIMFSMGTSIKIQHLKIILVRPVGPIIGAVCQLILMPACCCGYALLLNLPDNIAIGMVLVGSTPGGSISNIMTFWTKADVILSVCMTTISTTLALGFLPLNMFIYSRFWTDEVVIPYLNMVITVLYLWVSVIIGYFVGRKWPKSVPYFTKIGSVCALILILVAGVVQKQAYPETSEHIWQTYVASITMPVIGFVIGFVLAWIFCLGIKQRLAIGFETGIQNTALALTVLAISFPTLEESSYWSQFVILYTTYQVVLGIGTVICIWLYNLIRYCETPCTPKDGVEVTEMENKKRETGMVEETVHRSITTDENAEQCRIVRMVSVMEDDDTRPIITDDNIETASSSRDSDTGVSSLSESTFDDVKGHGKDEEHTAVVNIDKGESVSVETCCGDEQGNSVEAAVSSVDLTLTITSEGSYDSQSQ